jgi:hypothetical protein
MRNNKIFKAMVVAAPIMLSTPLMAQTILPTFTFTTVADVAITPITLVNFGASIIPIATNVCVLTPVISTSAATSGAVVLGVATVAGTGCNDAATDAEAGEYDITGAVSASVDVTLSVSDAAVTDYDYDPEASFMNGTATTTITTGVPSTVTLDATGAGLMVIGGTLTINADLAYATTFNTTTYTIDITY